MLNKSKKPKNFLSDARTSDQSEKPKPCAPHADAKGYLYASMSHHGAWTQDQTAMPWMDGFNSHVKAGWIPKCPDK